MRNESYANEQHNIPVDLSSQWQFVFNEGFYLSK